MARTTTSKKSATPRPETKDPESKVTLDERPPLDAEAALETIEADAEADGVLEAVDPDEKIWPEVIAIELGEETFEYATSPIDDVLSFIQMAFTFDSKTDEKIRSFLVGALAPGEYDLFAEDVRGYMMRAKAAGEKIEADVFFRQLSVSIFDRFSKVVTPKDATRSAGRRRTGRPSRLPR